MFTTKGKAPSALADGAFAYPLSEKSIADPVLLSDQPGVSRQEQEALGVAS